MLYSRRIALASIVSSWGELSWYALLNSPFLQEGDLMNIKIALIILLSSLLLCVIILIASWPVILHHWDIILEYWRYSNDT